MARRNQAGQAIRIVADRRQSASELAFNAEELPGCVSNCQFVITAGALFLTYGLVVVISYFVIGKMADQSRSDVASGVATYKVLLCLKK